LLVQIIADLVNTVAELPEYIPVPEQIEANPDFPTVPFPNPEEGKGALVYPCLQDICSASLLVVCGSLCLWLVGFVEIIHGNC
jgi:hypothetical protein